MGTSLTGTKPKDTYDSLIKVGDNGPISGTAKVLSDGLGNDLPIAVSTSNVGIGTSSPDNVLDLGSPSQGRGLTFDNYSNIFSSYSAGDLVLSSNFYGNTASDSYLTSTTATFGAAGIRISGTQGPSTSGQIQFFANAAASKTAGTAFTPTEVCRVTPNGLTFNGDTAAANALSDYEQGTFTPQLGTGGDTSGMVYATQLGEYTKIGNLVNIRIAITLTTLGGSVGNAYIYNLPFTNGSSVSVIGSASIFNATALMDNVTFLIDGSANYISLLKNNSISGITKADLTNTTVMFFNASYRV